MSPWFMIALVLVIGYIVLYLTGRNYLRENFSESRPKAESSILGLLG